MGVACSECVKRANWDAKLDSEVAARTADGRRSVLESHIGESPSEDYDILDVVIDEGRFTDVRLVTSKTTHAKCALKTVSKDAKESDLLKREIDIVLRMDHPHIARLFDVYEDFMYVYMVFEFCSGGDLMDAILEVKHFSERKALALLGQLFSAILYMHTRGVAHRDLNLDKLLLYEKVDDIAEAHIKLIDFSVARRFIPGKASMSTVVGSPFFIAPEMIHGEEVAFYTEKCDIWSAGVLAYMMYSGAPPFKGKTPEDIVMNVKEHKLHFPGRLWKHITAESRDMVKSMLIRDVDDRVDAQGALQNWRTAQAAHQASRETQETPRSTEESPRGLVEDTPRSVSTAGTMSPNSSLNPGFEIDKNFFKRLKTFGTKSHFVKSARYLVARHLDSTHLKDLKAVFQAMDENGDGMLTLEEAKRGMTQAGFDVAEIMKTFEMLDSDKSNTIDYTEFVAALMDKAHFKREELCWEAFRVFDKDHDGHIDIEDLREALTITDSHLPKMTKAEAEALIREHDQDGDKKISFKEFVAMMEKSADGE